MNIRLNSTVRFTLPSCTPSTTLGQVKDMISEIEASGRIEPARQRIIYRGRVLRDDSQTLSDIGFEDNSTLHLVKGAATPASSTPAPASTTSDIPNLSPLGSNSSFNNNGSNPMGMGNNPFGMGMGMGMPNPSPEQMRQMMNNPLFTSMMDQMMQNPEMLSAMMQMNPAMREMLDNNPQLRHVMEDPAVMRQAMQAMRNPEMMGQMMRNQDLAMSQIENLPGGFNALRRMYEEVQEPMMEAMAQDPSTNNSSSNEGSNTNRSNRPTAEAMPNPWGSPAPAPTSSPPSIGGVTGNSSNPNSNTLENAFGNLNMMQPPNMNIEQTIQMLENPEIRSMMDSITSNPETFRAMVDSNPMMRQMMQNNPAAASMMSNPEMMRNFLNPDNLRAINQMQQAMQQLRGNMNVGAPGATVSNQGPAASTPTTSQAPAGALDFSALLNNSGSSPNNTAPLPGLFSQMSNATATQPASVRYASQISTMEEMGFSDKDANARALEACGGNINRAIDWLLSRT